MKTKRFILGMMACAALCACSDDPSENGGVKPTLTGDQAYLTVRINYANDTRADDGGLEYGIDPTEHDIKSADFYFYDEKGVFVSQANVWDGGTANTNNPTENIEFKGESVVVLKGLEGKGYPKYMVTVLNAPGSFTPGATLKEMETKMAGDYKNSNGYFIMSTTSYKHKASTTDPTPATPSYFVTEITADNLETEPVADPKNAVVVYVERLAAKVTLNFDNETLKPVGENTYSIKVTVAGDDNKDNETTEGDETQTTPDIGAEEMYVHILGWGLTATTQDSYMMKNIDTDWNLAWKTANDIDYDWNDADRFRSYWGKSYNYGTGIYPSSANNTTDATLKYLTANQVLNLTNNKLGNSQYCNENTNTKEIVTEYFTDAVTNILLIAKVTAPDGGELNYVKYRGILYKEADFIKYVLNRIQYVGTLDLNIWTKTGEGEGAVFSQIDENKFELEHKGDGVVIVKMKQLAEGEKLYALNAGATPDENGKYAEDDFSEIDLTADFIKDIDTALAAFDANNKATGFKGGLMYYTIPIEHLNNAGNVTENDKTYKPEGRYGIVRNHHYKVTVNSLIRLGQGIFDPSEIVIPGASDPKETYYVGATINVLSWKVVDQTVGL